MAVLEWRGGTSSVFSDKTNWIDQSTGATPANAPANNDTLVFNWGSVSVSGATTGLTGVTIICTQDYSGTVGLGNPLNIGVASVSWRNGPSLNLAGAITTGSVRCRTGAFTHNTGAITAIYIERTNYAFGPASVVTRVRAKDSNGSDENNATGYTAAVFEGGSHSTRRSIVADVSGGATLRVMTQGSLGDGTIVSGRGRLLYASGEDVGAAVDVEVRPGATFDAGASAGFAWPGTLIRWAGAKINLDTPGGKVVPNTVTEFGFGEDIGDPVQI